MNMTKVQFVLTVPAVWSDSAKDATLKAAEKAGMGSGKDLKLISEPEAAAVYTLKAIQPNNLKIGDNFIVCDAGMCLFLVSWVSSSNCLACLTIEHQATMLLTRHNVLLETLF